MVNPLHALDRSVSLFCSHISPYVSWSYIRIIQRAEGTYLDFWMYDLFSPHGRSIFRISTALGSNVFLGSTGNRKSFSAIPFIGPDLAVWIRGDFVVGDATLNRFFAFHVIAIPFVIAGLVVAHNCPS